MVGWRHFGIEIGEDTKVLARALHGEFGDCDEMEIMDGFLCLYIHGYGNLPSPDPHLIDILRSSRERGYYLMMNNTTDTGEGMVRFERGGELVDISTLVDDEIEEGEAVFDGENSRLPECQLGAPYWGTVYELLYHENMPVAATF